MKDQGINRGLVQDFNTSDKRMKGAFYGFRKMFWKYLTKLHVGFYDPCCEEAGDAGATGVRFNDTTGVIEYWDPGEQAWTDVAAWVNPTTTTTTSTSTTTTTSSTTTTTTAP